MNVERVLAELIEERKLIDQAIASLQRMSATAKGSRGGQRRRPSRSFVPRRIPQNAKRAGYPAE